MFLRRTAQTRGNVFDGLTGSSQMIQAPSGSPSSWLSADGKGLSSYMNTSTPNSMSTQVKGWDG